VTDAPDHDPDSDPESLDVEGLVEQARAAAAGAGTTEEIRQVSTALSGKKSALAQASRRLGSLEPDARKALGQRLHDARKAIEGLIEQRRVEISFEELSREMAESRIDLTEFIPGSVPAPTLPGHSTWCR